MVLRAKTRRRTGRMPWVALVLTEPPVSAARALTGLLVTLGLSSLGVAAAVAAADLPAVGTTEVALQSAYSFGISDDVQSVTFFPRVGQVVHVSEGRRPAVVTFGVEGMFSRIFESSHAMELGGGLLLRYRLMLPRVQPYAEIGGAMLYADLRGYNLGSRVLFAAQGAVGLQIPLTGGGLAATGGYRFRHISNAGQSPNNAGLESNLVTVGLCYQF
jgi:lipid A 3-O-deacylase